jgi:hypothetical protein
MPIFNSEPSIIFSDLISLRRRIALICIKGRPKSLISRALVGAILFFIARPTRNGVFQKLEADAKINLHPSPKRD